MPPPANMSTVVSQLDLASISSNYGYLTLLFIPVLTVLGNLLVIAAVLVDKQLKKSVTNRYIAALAFSDFVIGVIPMPLAVYVKVNGEHWNLGVAMCKFYVACDVTSSTASILHLLIISADRYLAISWPAEYQRYARKAKIKFAIVLVWLISITLSIPVVMGKSILDTETCWLNNPEYMIYSSLLSFYIPAGVLTLVYVKIFRKIRARQHIHSMLRAGSTACGADVTPFHLPFVVVQEVSFDDQGSSGEKRLSGEEIPCLPAVIIDQSEPTRPSDPRPANHTDDRGCYQLVPVSQEANHPRRACSKEVLNCVSKSRTFPTALAEEAETLFAPNEGQRRNRKNCSGNSLVDVFELEKPEAGERSNLGMQESRIGRRRKKERSEDEDAVRLLTRTASEKRIKERAVQSPRHLRRFSLWYHSCQHVSTSTNGGCIVLHDDEEDKPDIHAQVGHAIFSRALGSSTLALKPGSKFLQKLRRTSSLEVKFSSTANAQTHRLTIDPSTAVSVSTSVDFESDVFGSKSLKSSAQADDEEDEDPVAAVYALPASVHKNRPGFNLKKLANRVTNALHRITETQAVTKEKKATKLVALILGIFVISWLPFFTFNTMRGICLSASSFASDCEWLNSHVFFVTSWLGYANSSFNPIIYGLVNQHFRRTYKKLLGWPLKRRL